MKRTILVLLVSMFLSACSSNTNKTVDSIDSNSQFHPIAYISMYRSNSLKVQPELIAAINDVKKINKVLNWKKGAFETNLPSTIEIQRIYIIQIDFEKEKKVEKANFYMYITDKSGNEYLKPFELNHSKYDINHYNSSKNQSIINTIGADHWYKVIPLSLLK